MIKLAARIDRVEPSITLQISAKAKAMQAEGIDICSFTAGEPDFDTPQPIKEAAKRALDAGKTKYGPAAGEPKLREAIANYLQTYNELNYHKENIIVTNGGKQSLYNLMQVLIEPGDEVIIPSPYWVSYPEMVRLAGGKSVFVQTKAETGYKITSDQLKQAITPKTKLFILNSPSNPTGAVYTRREIEALAQVVVEQDILVVSDEIYDRILYDGAQHLSIGAVNQKTFERTIVSSGFAKNYAMTGWRVGYLAAPIEITKAMITIQGHSTSNVCTFAQWGAIAALTEDQSCVEQMRQQFAERRQLMIQKLSQIEQLSFVIPQGAFYVFVDISSLGLDSMQFCKMLLDQHNCATIPGIAFGADHCIRLSYATDIQSIAKGIDRIKTFVDSVCCSQPVHRR